ncbi:hypothetical protein HAX54_000546 [Datura stramonium]|uniref:Oligosaccharyltransferase complex subunit n=1 Tax=Datura stramonium TaxID=4076 RepID=A0ABS8T2A5_DATST|nr:hypothetical protein [Datura stramonium]
MTTPLTHFHILRILPFSFLRPPKLRLKNPTVTLPSAMTASLILLTYFMVVSGIVYDVIVEPPGIGSTQDRFTGAVKPVVFLPGLLMNREKSVAVSFATAGIVFVASSLRYETEASEVDLGICGLDRCWLLKWAQSGSHECIVIAWCYVPLKKKSVCGFEEFSEWF